jgi:starch phosphorylase
MQNLCFIGCKRVTGVSEEQTDFLKTLFYRELDDLYTRKLCNISTGLSQRQWIVKTNPQLAKLLTQTLGSEDQWVRDLYLLKQIEARNRDPKFTA